VQLEKGYRGKFSQSKGFEREGGCRFGGRDGVRGTMDYEKKSRPLAQKADQELNETRKLLVERKKGGGQGIM